LSHEKGGKKLSTHITAQLHPSETHISTSTYCVLPWLFPTLNHSGNYTYQQTLALTNSSLLPHSVMKRRAPQFSPESGSHLKIIFVRRKTRLDLHTKTHKHQQHAYTNFVARCLCTPDVDEFQALKESLSKCNDSFKTVFIAGPPVSNTRTRQSHRWHYSVLLLSGRGGKHKRQNTQARNAAAAAICRF